MLDTERISVLKNGGSVETAYDTGGDILTGTGNSLSSSLSDLAEQLDEIGL